LSLESEAVRINHKEEPMIRPVDLVLATVGLTFSCLSTHAIAASNVVVQINGTDIQSPSGCNSSTTEVVLSECDGAERNYLGMGIKIKGVGTVPAKVTTVDGAEDKLQLVNAIITATQNQPANCNANDDSKYMNCTTIFYSALFEKGPDGTTDPIPYFRESISSTMKRNANPASGSSFRINGWINDLNNPGDLQIGYVQKKLICATPASCQNVSFGQTGVMYNPSLAGQRELKAQLWFGLKFTGDVLTITSAHDSTTAGGGIGNKVGKGSVMILNDPEEGDDGRNHGGGKGPK
jgi:hypothetical protein